VDIVDIAFAGGLAAGSSRRVDVEHRACACMGAKDDGVAGFGKELCGSWGVVRVLGSLRFCCLANGPDFSIRVTGGVACRLVRGSLL
jgi:hypothetical protein